MNLNFDPLNEREASAVRMILDTLRGDVVPFDVAAGAGMVATITPAQERTIVAEINPVPVTPASAVPLPPTAPSTAAADIFPTAPEAPTAGPAVATSVPLPPVPAPPVPTAPAGATSPVVLDKNGLPWDERIHSGSKEKNKDGSWRQRRGTDLEYVAEVERELRALLANPVPAAPVSAVPLPPPVPSAAATAEPSPEVPAAPVTVPDAPIATAPAIGTATPPLPATAAPEVPNVAPASSPVPTAPIPTPPVPPAPTAAAGIATTISFAELMSKVTKCLQSGKVTESDVHAALESVDLGPNEIGKLAKPGDESATNRLCVAAILDEKSGDV